MKLSQREKTLLTVLALLVLLIVAWKFLLGPAFTKKQNLETEISSMESEKIQIDTMAKTEAALRQNLADAKTEMEAESFFYRGLIQSDVDRLISAYAEAHNVTIDSMRIDAAEVVPLSGYTSSETPLYSSFRDQRIKFDEAAAEAYQQESGTEQALTASDITIPLYHCQISVSGKLQNVTSMINEINSSGRSIYVSSIGTVGGNIEDGAFSDTIDIEIYFLED